QSLIVGDAEIVVTRTRHGAVQLGIKAPDSIDIYRKELGENRKWQSRSSTQEPSPPTEELSARPSSGS
ncbi:MAG: carbon storage regulator, partial [Planctomycetes bacterium]|nr:carbon storage regulator [Planctomycetota bacterium]